LFSGKKTSAKKCSGFASARRLDCEPYFLYDARPKGETDMGTTYVRCLYFDNSSKRDRAYSILEKDSQFRSAFSYVQKHKLRASTMFTYAIAVGPYTYDTDHALIAAREALSKAGCDWEETEMVTYDALMSNS
jgi:hypothetical protein